MNSLKPKIIYLFNDPMLKHYHIYIGYCKEFANNDFKTEILTFLSPRDYFKNIIKMVGIKKFYRQKKLRNSFYLSIHKSRKMQITIKLLIEMLFNRKIVIILKKIDIEYMCLIKKISKRIILIYENEGDFVSECNYLEKVSGENNKHVIKNYKLNIQKSKEIYRICDYIIAGSKSMASLLRMRYSYISNKTDYMIPAFSKKVFCFDKEIRYQERNKLGINDMKVYIYTGNVLYKWQNFSTNVKLFKEILKRNEKSYFIVLVPSRDLMLAKKYFIDEDIDESKYLVKSVESYEIAKYLMASDMAFVIRDIHTMNYTAPTGKTGEYLATGLPLIYIRALSVYNSFVLENNHGVIEYKKEKLFDRIDDIVRFTVDDRRRQLISKEAIAIFSFESNAYRYINIIMNLTSA